MSRISLLIVNPNSSRSITDSLALAYCALSPSARLTFFTGPPSAPPSIDDTPTSLQSTAACLPLLTSVLEEGDSVGNAYDGVLVACYSAHPLVPALRTLVPHVPVIGIFEASVAQALLLADTFGIVTTGAGWEPLLTQAVHDFLGVGEKGASARFAGVQSTGLGVLELHALPAAEVRKRMGDAARVLVGRGAGAICLGCAGMAGLGEAVREAVGDGVRVVDVTSGLAVLEGLVTCQRG